MSVENTNGNSIEIAYINETLYIEPLTNSSSLKASTKPYIYTHTSKATLSIIDEENEEKQCKQNKIHEQNEEILNKGEHIAKKSKTMKNVFIKPDKNEKSGDTIVTLEKTNKSLNILGTMTEEDDSDNNNNGVTMDKDENKSDLMEKDEQIQKVKQKCPGTFISKIPNKANADVKTDENDNVELISEVLSDAWKTISDSMEEKWTHMIVNESFICESFPNEQILFYYLKYTMLIQQINGYYTTFKYNDKKYVIFSTELKHRKNKCIMYIVGVKEDNEWKQEAFMNGFMTANEINDKYGIKEDSLPIGTRLNSKIFKGIHSFEYSLINNISCAMYANISCIKTSQKKKNKLKI
eukprot:115092_1